VGTNVDREHGLPPQDEPGARLDVGAFLVLALALRLAVMLAMPRVLDTADAIHYLDAARKLVAFDWFGLDPKIPLLYPALTAILYPLTGLSLIAAVLLDRALRPMIRRRPAAS